MVSFLLQFVVPCIIITLCYYKVSSVMYVRCKTPMGTGAKSRQREEQEIRRKRRTNHMLIAVVCIFVFCWIPLNTLWIVTDMMDSDKVKNTSAFILIFFTCHLLAMSSVVYNPFIYAWMNENFKKEFRQIVSCLIPKQIVDTSQNDSRLNTTFHMSAAEAVADESLLALLEQQAPGRLSVTSAVVEPVGGTTKRGSCPLPTSAVNAKTPLCGSVLLAGESKVYYHKTSDVTNVDDKN